MLCARRNYRLSIQNKVSYAFMLLPRISSSNHCEFLACRVYELRYFNIADNEAEEEE